MEKVVEIFWDSDEMSFVVIAYNPHCYYTGRPDKIVDTFSTLGQVGDGLQILLNTMGVYDG